MTNSPASRSSIKSARYTPSWAKPKTWIRRLTALEGAPTGGRGGRGAAAGGPDTLNSVRAALSNLLRLLQEADVAPTTQEAAAVAGRHKAFTALQQRWTALQREISQANISN